jgi:predicted nucleic acid-binding protein
MSLKKVYWDTSCFISFLSSTHPGEVQRANICQDVLNNARNDQIEIWTSVWTIVETLRPKTPYQAVPLPLWADLLKSADKDGNPLHPNAHTEFEKVWTYFQRNTAPSRKLSDADAQKIRRMFDWSWIKKIQVIPVIAQRAADIARNHNMKPGDAIHVASAIHRNCDLIQRWDRDYTRTDALIKSEEPTMITVQGRLGLLPPNP